MAVGAELMRQPQADAIASGSSAGRVSEVL
jgi:hypothetical protein